MRRLTRNQTLALVAVVLGAIAMIGDPYGGSRVTLDTRELATIVETEVDHVTAEELAEWILTGDADYRLIDLRDEASFAEYHIPTAEHVPISALPDYPLMRDETIVLYSDGGIHSAQAWFLLKAHRYPGAYMLLGGLDAWMDEVLFPVLPDDAGADQAAAFERKRYLAEHFGGAPRGEVESAEAAAPVPLPKMDASAQTVVPTRKKKKKEGC